MALFGSFGKSLGLGTAGEVAGDIARFFGAPASIANPISSAAQSASEAISSIGEDRPDVATSPAQAGVDSPSTILNVSQTGQLSPGGMGGRLPMDTQMAGAAVFGLPGLITGAARQLAKPGVGGLIGGIGAGAAVDTVVDMFGREKKLVITRKLQRDVKKVFILSGGSFAFVSAQSMRLFGKRLSEDQIVEILFKTFKNQGPFITKAAMRKTSSTLRKLDRICSMRDAMRPPARRRATTTRKMSTNITQVK